MRGAFKIGPYSAGAPRPKKNRARVHEDRTTSMTPREAKAKSPGPPIGEEGMPTPGMPQGRRIKRSITMAIELLEDCEISPLEYLLGMMKQEIPPRMEGEPVVVYCERLMHARSLKFEAAKAAAPYMHPKIGPIDHKEFKNTKNIASQIAQDIRDMLEASGDGLPVSRKKVGE